MSTRDDHLRLLHQGPFPVPTDSVTLTAAERELLVASGFWLEGLASGVLIPFTAEQARFVEVAKGRVAPVTEHERAWVKYRPPVAKRSLPQAVTPASISQEDEIALRRLRGMLVRGEVSSGFADSVLRQWEEAHRIAQKQLTAVRRLLAGVDARVSTPHVATGGSRKPGSHRSNW